MTVNPSTSLPKFGISEWLAAFSFVVSFYLLLSLDDVVEILTQKRFKLNGHLNVILVNNIMCYLCFSSFSMNHALWFFLLWVSTLVNKHNVVYVRIPCDVGSSICLTQIYLLVEMCIDFPT